MKSALLGLLLLPLTGCLIGDDDDGACPPTHIVQSYDVTITCPGGMTYENKADFNGDLRDTLNASSVSGSPDSFRFVMQGDCSSGESKPQRVEVSFLFRTDEYGNVVAYSDERGATGPRAYCDLSLGGQSTQTATCFRMDNGGDVACHAMLTTAP